jgi:hypothetical protein
MTESPEIRNRLGEISRSLKQLVEIFETGLDNLTEQLGADADKIVALLENGRKDPEPEAPETKTLDQLIYEAATAPKNPVPEETTVLNWYQPPTGWYELGTEKPTVNFTLVEPSADLDALRLVYGPGGQKILRSEGGLEAEPEKPVEPISIEEFEERWERASKRLAELRAEKHKLLYTQDGRPVWWYDGSRWHRL